MDIPPIAEPPSSAIGRVWWFLKPFRHCPQVWKRPTDNIRETPDGLPDACRTRNLLTVRTFHLHLFMLRRVAFSNWHKRTWKPPFRQFITNLWCFLRTNTRNFTVDVSVRHVESFFVQLHRLSISCTLLSCQPVVVTSLSPKLSLYSLSQCC